MSRIRKGDDFRQDIHDIHVLRLVSTELGFLCNRVDGISQHGIIGLSKSRYIEVKGDVSTVLNGFQQESSNGFPQVVWNIVHVADSADCQ